MDGTAIATIKRRDRWTQSCRGKGSRHGALVGLTQSRNGSGSRLSGRLSNSKSERNDCRLVIKKS